MRDKVTRQCTRTTTFEEKGELKRIRTEVLLLTNLTPYRWAKLAHKFNCCLSVVLWLEKEAFNYPENVHVLS